jgi:hypothetical protein
MDMDTQEESPPPPPPLPSQSQHEDDDDAAASAAASAAMLLATPICAALFPQATDGSTTNNKWSAPPLPLPVLEAFERWMGGLPSPPELLELGSAPPPDEDE